MLIVITNVLVDKQAQLVLCSFYGSAQSMVASDFNPIISTNNWNGYIVTNSPGSNLRWDWETALNRLVSCFPTPPLITSLYSLAHHWEVPGEASFDTVDRSILWNILWTLILLPKLHHALQLYWEVHVDQWKGFWLVRCQCLPGLCSQPRFIQLHHRPPHGCSVQQLHYCPYLVDLFT